MRYRGVNSAFTMARRNYEDLSSLALGVQVGDCCYSALGVRQLKANVRENFISRRRTLIDVMLSPFEIFVEIEKRRVGHIDMVFVGPLFLFLLLLASICPCVQSSF